VRRHEVRGGGEEFLHETKFFFAETGLGENHAALSAFYLRRRSLPVLLKPKLKGARGGPEYFYMQIGH
jgi:hypothetical protein